MSQNERAEDPSCKERQREQVNGFELLIYHETHRPRCVDRCSGGGRCRFDGKPVGFFRAFYESFRVSWNSRNAIMELGVPYEQLICKYEWQSLVMWWERVQWQWETKSNCRRSWSQGRPEGGSDEWKRIKYTIKSVVSKCNITSNQCAIIKRSTETFRKKSACRSCAYVYVCMWDTERDRKTRTVDKIDEEGR